MEVTLRNRMPNYLAFFLMLGALIMYGLSALADFIWCGWLVDSMGWLIFSAIFRFRGAKFSKNGLIASIAISFIPWIGGFIGDIGGMWWQIHIIRKEDKLYNEQQIAQLKSRNQEEAENMEAEDEQDAEYEYNRRASA